MRKTTVALAAAALALCASSSASAADYGDSVSAAPSPEAMAFDLVVVRPLGAVATVLGTALFVVSLPVDLLAWNITDPAQRLVVEPAKFTFTRELGDIQ